VVKRSFSQLGDAVATAELSTVQVKRSIDRWGPKGQSLASLGDMIFFRKSGSAPACAGAGLFGIML
jgi:hypothetical protein